MTKNRPARLIFCYLKNEKNLCVSLCRLFSCYHIWWRNHITRHLKKNEKRCEKKQNLIKFHVFFKKKCNLDIFWFFKKSYFLILWFFEIRYTFFVKFKKSEKNEQKCENEQNFKMNFSKKIKDWRFLIFQKIIFFDFMNIGRSLFEITPRDW